MGCLPSPYVYSAYLDSSSAIWQISTHTKYVLISVPGMMRNHRRAPGAARYSIFIDIDDKSKMFEPLARHKAYNVCVLTN